MHPNVLKFGRGKTLKFLLRNFSKSFSTLDFFFFSAKAIDDADIELGLIN